MLPSIATGGGGIKGGNSGPITTNPVFGNFIKGTSPIATYALIGAVLFLTIILIKKG